MLSSLRSKGLLSLPGFMALVYSLFLAGFFVYGAQSAFWALSPDLLGRELRLSRGGLIWTGPAMPQRGPHADGGTTPMPGG